MGLLSFGMTDHGALAQESCNAAGGQLFKIELLRLGEDVVDDKGAPRARIFGDIGVNDANIGRFYENPAVKIAAGTYLGALRYNSDHHFVQSACGEMARDGDFLLEVTGVRAGDGSSRTNLLFHPGSLPSHSAGCILLGNRVKAADGTLLPLASDNPLLRLRRLFYGSDTPIACPNKHIVIIIKDIS